MTLSDERAKQAVLAALRWMKAHTVEWLKTEEKIYSKKYDFAGTLDGVAYVDSCSDPACCTEQYKHRMCLIDFKTSNHLSTPYCFQTAAYQQAIQEENKGAIEGRFVLRLGKSDEEAGKFEPWFLSNKDFVTDLDAFLTCLSLTRLVDTVESRMKTQKGTIRAVKKEQRETAKALKKEQEKLQKALDKAAAKLLKDAEKARIKEEVKAERERLKAEKKAGIACGFTSQETMEKQTITLSDSLLPAQPNSLLNPFTPAPEMPQPVAIILTEAQAQPLLTEEVKAILEPAKVKRPANAVVYEEEAVPLSYSLPME